MIRRFVLAGSCALTLACTAAAPPPPPQLSAEERLKRFADAYLEAYLARYPETVTQYGVPGRHHDALTDNSLTAFRQWNVKQDQMLLELKEIERAGAVTGPLRAT